MEFSFFLNTLWKYVSESVLDLFALSFFLVGWFGYSAFVDNLVHSSRGLSSRMHLHRLEWMKTALHRENKILDINIINSLSHNIAFFASTSILIIAGFLAILSATDTALDLIRELPFATQPTLMMWYIKVSLLICMFIYAFFKYTWALRQINYASILLGALPYTQAKEHHEKFVPAGRRAAIVMTMAARHMNRGQRTYYFAIAALTWFIGPWLLILTTLIVAFVLYRREFSSDIVNVLNMPGISATTLAMSESLQGANNQLMNTNLRDEDDLADPPR
jgi:uncharacterized membrane protein